MATEFFTASDGHELALYRLKKEGTKGHVLIVHGMAEHGMRYERFARALAEDHRAAGWRVISFDLRGHGRTSERNGLRGSFGKGGWRRVVQDVEEIGQQLQRELPEGRFILFGHSMGSMVAGSTAARKQLHLDQLVLSAFPPYPGLLVYAGIGLAGFLSLFGQRNRPSKLMNALTFGSFSKGIKNKKTDFDWLSRDAEEVAKYISDPDCGEVFTTGFFGQLASLTDFVHSKIKHIPAELPVLYIAGSDDPVVEKARGAQYVVDKLNKHLPHSHHHIFEGARHELLNETNRDEVTSYLISAFEEVE